MLSPFPSQYWFTIGLLGVFSLTGWSPQIQTGFHVSRPTQVPLLISQTYLYRTITVFGRIFQNVPVREIISYERAYYPDDAVTTSVWALPRSIATTKGIDKFFLFLGVLRCCSSPRLLQLIGDMSSTCRVAPFGNHRVNTCLQLTGAYRSLPRPSSPPEA